VPPIQGTHLHVLHIVESYHILTESQTSNGQYGHAYMCAAIKSHQHADASGKDPCQELQAYLAVPLEEVVNVIAWWG